MKFTFVIVAVILIGVLGFVIDAQSRTPVIRPESQPGGCTIFAAGRVEGATQEIELRFQLSGRIEELLVEEGQLVQKGEVLLRLIDAQYRHEAALAAADVKLAEAQLERLINGARPQERAVAAALYRAKLAELELAKLSWKRTDKLRADRTVTQQKVDNDRIRVATLMGEVEAARARMELLEAPARLDEIHMDEARVLAAKARLELANVRLERTRLRAPCRGRILEIDVETGELTGPESLDPAIVLADTSSFRVRAFVEELDAPRVQVGMKAKIVADGLPGQELEGHVTRSSLRMGHKEIWTDQPNERFDTKTREVWIEIKESQSLVVGLPVDVMIDPDPIAPIATEPVRSEGMKPDGSSSSEPETIAQLQPT